MATESNGESTIVLHINDVLPSYTDMLTNANYVLNMLEDLEAGQSWSEYFSDWQIGERVNVQRMRKYLEKLKKELENGMKVYTKYIFTLDHSESIQKIYKRKLESNVAVSTVANYDKKCMAIFIENQGDLSNAIEKMAHIGIFKGKEREIGGCEDEAMKSGALLTTGTGIVCAGLLATGLIPITLGTVGVAAAVSLFAGVLGSVAYAYNYSKGKKRAIEYQELNFLYNELHDDKTLAVFQTHHKKIAFLIEGFNGVRESCKEQYQIALQPIPSSMESANPMEDFSKAIKLYKDTFKEEIEELTSSEADMNGERRDKLATRAAVRVCKTFLKEKLRCSDTQADEFIKTLQI